MSDITIPWLGIYPIKSCASATVNGRDITEAFVSARGLMFGRVPDRQLMLLDSTNTFITQREQSALARVKIALMPGADGIAEKLLISANGMGSFVLDYNHVTEENVIATMHMKNGQREKAPVHIMGGPASKWFQTFLGDSHVRLAYQTDDDIRITDQSFATRANENDPVSLADGFQILVTSVPTLKKLNNGFDTAKPMDRFRPNIVIDGDLEANDENRIAFALYGNVMLAGVKPCARCKITGIDQETGISEGGDILKALNKTSKVHYQQGNTTVAGVIFGENMKPIETGPIRVGDKVTVIKTKLLPQFI